MWQFENAVVSTRRRSVRPRDKKVKSERWGDKGQKLGSKNESSWYAATERFSRMIMYINSRRGFHHSHGGLAMKPWR